jgi:hypothetical protein
MNRQAGRRLPKSDAAVIFRAEFWEYLGV